MVTPRVLRYFAVEPGGPRPGHRRAVAVGWVERSETHRLSPPGHPRAEPARPLGRCRPRLVAAGFTLIEMVCVVTILAIVTAIVVPRFGNSLARQRADMVATRIARDLTHARRHARLTSASQKVVFNVALNRYALPGVPGLNRAGTGFIVNLGEEPYRAKLVSANLGGDAEIIFDGFGRPDSGGEVIVRVHGHVRKITIDPETGRTEVSETVDAAPTPIG